MSAHPFLRAQTIHVFTMLTDVIVEASPARKTGESSTFPMSFRVQQDGILAGAQRAGDQLVRALATCRGRRRRRPNADRRSAKLSRVFWEEAASTWPTVEDA
jgi:hypothetical protein